jgi:outer membrane receptor for ferrienterochelin and colicins
MTRLPRMAILVSTALGLAHAASGQNLHYGDLEQMFGEPVTSSATGQPQRVSEAPVDMEIVTQEDIRRSGATDIPGALRFVPGIDERVYGVMHSEIGVRGYNQPYNPRLLVLLNGQQVYLDDYGEVDWNSIPVELSEIRQIEVVKGPNSALYGFNGAYGVINIVTYDSLDDDVNVANITAGLPGTIGGSLVKSFKMGETAGVRISLGGQQSRMLAGTSLYLPDTPAVTARAGKAALNAKLQINPQTQLSLDLSTTNSQGAYNEGYSYSNVFIRTNSERLSLISETGMGVLTIDGYRNEERYSDDPNYGALHGQVYVLHVSDDAILNASNTIRLNAEYRSDQLTLPGGEISYDIYAGAGMWDWQITDRLSLVNSFRIDYLKLHFDGQTAPFSGLTAADYAKRSITGFSFNSGLVYKISDLDSLHLVAGRGLQIPSLYDLGIQEIFDGTPPPYGLIGNPHLEPTSVLNVGVGYERDLPSLHSKLSLSVFAQRSDDIYNEPSSAPGVTVANGESYYFATKVGYGMAAGFEATLKGSLPSGLRWRASYSFATTPDHTGTQIADIPYSYVDFGHSTPRHVVILGLGDTWGRFEADIQARWQSGYRDFVAPNQIDLLRYDIKPYVTVNARLGYRLTDDMTIAVTTEQLNSPSRRQTGGPPVERRFTFSATSHF